MSKLEISNDNPRVAVYRPITYSDLSLPNVKVEQLLELYSSGARDKLTDAQLIFNRDDSPIRYPNYVCLVLMDWLLSGRLILDDRQYLAYASTFGLDMKEYVDQAHTHSSVHGIDDLKDLSKTIDERDIDSYSIDPVLRFIPGLTAAIAYIEKVKQFIQDFN